MNPSVTVVLPVRNEAKSIAATLAAVFAQDYPSELMEVLIVDGASTDGTHEIVAGLQASGTPCPVRVLQNSRGIVPTGLNIALGEARGDIVVRVDAHTIIAPDYVRQCVTALQSTGADNVGGRMSAVGTSLFGRCVAVATTSPFGVGGGRFHFSEDEEWVDTVYMGAWPRSVFREIGLFDEELVRDQDDEFNYRLRRAGGKILLVPKIRSKYAVRSRPAALWKQYFQYGFWKVRVLQKHPLQMSPRQFAPPALVLCLLFSAILATLPSLHVIPWLVGIPALLAQSASLVVPALYLLANLLASTYTALRMGWKYLPLLPMTFAILHLSYGLGFVVGFVRFMGRWGDRMGRVPDWSVGRVPRIEPLVPAYMPSLGQPVTRIAKRAFDIFASSLGLLILSPFLGLVALSVRRETPGPAFYRGARIGRNGKPFNILKFRTMYEAQESYQGPQLTAHEDRRITPFGHWLRQTKFNELPQLWNVLKGEMSLVGPRPEVAEFVRAWPAEARREVLSMAPGMTSPASVLYRDEEKLLGSSGAMDTYLKSVMPDKLRLDQLYVRHHTVLGDLDVILTTFVALLPFVRESKFKPEILYNGAVSRFVRRYATWFMIDCVVALAAVSTAGLLWRLDRPLDLGLFQATIMAAILAIVFSLVNAVRGLGRISWRSARPAYAFDIFLSSGITTMGVAALNWFWPQGRFLPSAVVLVAGMLAFLGFLSVRYRERLLTGLAWRWLSGRGRDAGLRERVLIVGAGDCGLLTCWLLHHSQLSHAFSIAGMVDDNPSKDGMIVDGYPVFGLTRRIPELAKSLDIGVIIYAIQNIGGEERDRIMGLCKQTSARLVVIPDLLQFFGPSGTRDDRPHAVPITGLHAAADVQTRPIRRPDGVAGED